MGKPKIFNIKEELPEGVEILDAFERSLKELFFVRNPQFKKGMPGADEAMAKFMDIDAKKIRGVFVFYPWLNKAVYLPEEKIYFDLRTARNKNIINKDEQEKYRNLKVGIAGMSVG